MRSFWLERNPTDRQKKRTTRHRTVAAGNALPFLATTLPKGIRQTVFCIVHLCTAAPSLNLHNNCPLWHIWAAMGSDPACNVPMAWYCRKTAREIPLTHFTFKESSICIMLACSSSSCVFLSCLFVQAEKLLLSLFCASGSSLVVAVALIIWGLLPLVVCVSGLCFDVTFIAVTAQQVCQNCDCKYNSAQSAFDPHMAAWLRDMVSLLRPLAWSTGRTL